MTDMLKMYTIYKNPLDYPKDFVVRRHLVSGKGSIPDLTWYFIKDTLDDARSELARRVPGLMSLGREAQDEPQIVESWV